MTKNTIFDALKQSVLDIYKEDMGYFKYKAGREQSIQFRIAYKMAKVIEPMYKDLFVDCEPTRCNGQRKIKGKRPDIIVHQRYKDKKGYLVIEIKCNKRNWENDFDKLKQFTNQANDSQNCPTYMMGAFVYLGNTLDKVEITTFQNGAEYEVIKGL